MFTDEKEAPPMTQLKKNDLLAVAEKFLDESTTNYVAQEVALRPDLAGMRIFNAPLIAVADAADPLFTQLLAPEAVGPHARLPEYWVPGARSVISYYLPFASNVVEANVQAPAAEIASEWLHGRIEGQTALNAMAVCLRDHIVEAGYASVIPSLDDRLRMSNQPAGPDLGDLQVPAFSSNWSERHIAYVCGLGTFGLTRGLITALGTAGRFGSIVTTLPLEPDTRAYTRYDEYCTYCGECIPRCPAGAITLKGGKDQTTCSAFNSEVRAKHSPRYGCGKCNVGVPCAMQNPAAI